MGAAFATLSLCSKQKNRYNPLLSFLARVLLANDEAPSLAKGICQRRLVALSPSGGIGRRRGFKIPRRKACRFESGLGHHKIEIC